MPKKKRKKHKDKAISHARIKELLEAAVPGAEELDKSLRKTFRPSRRPVFYA